ncbi:MAG: hypothetical protein LBG65_03460 [Puniceicoccales bacterium]|nr:hypothetical protein [Puniceicoccales bacterium]
MLSAVTGPAHTVTNTYESNRDILITKQNKVTVAPQPTPPPPIAPTLTTP